MQCSLCGCKEHKKRAGSVRDNALLDIYECLDCGLVFLSSLEHMNNAFYETSKMHETVDFNKWCNETKEDDIRRFEFVRLMITNKTVLDFGSGNGGFLKEAKKIAKCVAGVELEKAVEPFYKEEKIALYNNLENIQEKFDVITAFHVIEHLKDPLVILEQLKNRLNENGKLIIEVPNANDALLTIYESEAFSNFTYWGCHLYLYTTHTLKILAKKARLKMAFTKYVQRYPLSNHLHWLSKKKPAGHTVWGNFIDSPELTRAYEAQLASLEATDTIIICLIK